MKYLSIHVFTCLFNSIPRMCNMCIMRHSIVFSSCLLTSGLGWSKASHFTCTLYFHSPLACEITCMGILYYLRIKFIIFHSDSNTTVTHMYTRLLHQPAGATFIHMGVRLQCLITKFTAGLVWPVY